MFCRAIWVVKVRIEGLAMAGLACWRRVELTCRKQRAEAAMVGGRDLLRHSKDMWREQGMFRGALCALSNKFEPASDEAQMHRTDNL